MSDNSFQSLRQRFAEAKKVERNTAYEETCLKRILKHAGVNIHHGRSVAEARAMFKADTLTFLWFHHKFPTFPVHLGAARIDYVGGRHFGWTELFGSGFRKLPWVVEYHAMADQCGYDLTNDRVALFFPAPKADKSGTMVPLTIAMGDVELIQ